MAAIAITKGLYTKVDAQDIAKVVLAGRWIAHSQGYAYRVDSSVKPKKSIMLHRFLTGAPDGLDVDHINGDRLDNRRDNLRVVSRAANNLNKPGAKLIEKRLDGKFLVRIKANGVKKTILTAIEDEQEALHVARDVRRQLAEGDAR